jgi:hypothetical protein
MKEDRFPWKWKRGEKKMRSNKKQLIFGVIQVRIYTIAI